MPADLFMTQQESFDSGKLSSVCLPLNRRMFLHGTFASGRFWKIDCKKEGSVPHTQAATKTKARAQGARPHQPGQAVSKAILSEDLEWKPFAAFPPSVRLAVIVGRPTQGGLYTIRVKVPHGVKLMPHKHPEDRTYTVISGIFYIGLGDQFDAEKLEAYPPGSVIVLPGDTSHFHWARS